MQLKMLKSVSLYGMLIPYVKEFADSTMTAVEMHRLDLRYLTGTDFLMVI